MTQIQEEPIVTGNNKYFKLSIERRLNISKGRLNSPILQAQKVATKRRKELRKQIRAQIKAEEIQRRGYILHSPQVRLRMLEYGNGSVAINKRFSKLLTSLRTANENDGTLDKKNCVYDDCFDSFRMAMQFYH